MIKTYYMIKTLLVSNFIWGHLRSNWVIQGEISKIFRKVDLEVIKGHQRSKIYGKEQFLIAFENKQIKYHDISNRRSFKKSISRSLIYTQVMWGPSTEHQFVSAPRITISSIAQKKSQIISESRTRLEFSVVNFKFSDFCKLTTI